MIHPSHKNKILISAFVSAGLFAFWIVATSSGYDRKSSWNDIGLWAIVSIGAIVFTALNLIQLVLLLKKGERARNVAFIFLSIHNLVWGVGYFLICFFMLRDREMAFWFLFPIVTGGFTLGKIYSFLLSGADKGRSGP